MRISFMLYFCLLSLISLAQPFQETILSSNITDPYAIECMDFNKDTYDDIIVSGLNQLIWYDNQNGLNYKKISIIDTINTVRDFEIVDYDLDTHYDIICITNDKLFWLENDGNMNFSYHLLTDTLTNARKVRAADMDNDGDIDILFSISDNFFDIFLYQNNGTNNTCSIIDRVDYNGIYIVDYNNDGDMDLLTKTNYSPFTTEELAILINNGSNVFTEQQIYEKTGNIDITEARFTYLNNDTTIDLLIADNIQKELYWLKSCNTRIDILSSQYISDVLAHDFNKDGVKDIVYKYEYSGSYKFYVLQGAFAGSTINFTQVLVYNLGTSSDYILPLDANADTCSDFAYISAARDEVAYMKNNNNFSFSLTRLATAITLPESMIRVDLDQDGDMDIVSVSSNEEIIWLDRKTDSTYEQKIIINTLDNPIQIAVDDIDEDGYSDIITASIGDADFSIWYNDGQQNFTEFFLTSTTAQLSNPSYFAICDLDNDNDKDFVIVASSTSTTNPKGIFWIRNEGSGLFSSPIVIKNNLNLMGELIVHDFDNDGNTDIIVADHEYGTSGLHVIKNNNNATSFTFMLPVPFRAVSIRKGDIDGDSLMDFVTRNDETNDIVWFKNNGNLTFTPHTIVMNENRDVRFELCDDGNDGHTDIFFYESFYGYTNYSDFNAGILKNDGNEVFTQTNFFENTYNILSAIPMDTDNDNDIDVFMGIDIFDKISFYKNFRINLLLPTINIWPTTSDIIYGDSLGQSVLSGGSTSVPGIFGFTDSSYVPDAGFFNAQLIFIPDNDSVYASITGQTTITVHKAVPVIYTWPQASAIEFGQSLNSSQFAGDSTSTPGIFTFDNPSNTPNLGVYTSNVTFTPNDTNNYISLIGTVDVVVTKANPLINLWPSASEINCGDTLGKAVLSGGSASVNGLFTFNNPSFMPLSGIYSAQISFIPNDNMHYNTISANVDILIMGLDTTVISHQFCEGTVYNFYGTLLNTHGIYYQQLTSLISGCDSVIKLELSENPNNEFIENAAICNGTSFAWHGNTYTTQGIYYDSLTTVLGCDSVYILHLNINPNHEFNENAAICNGTSFAWHGNTYTTQGIYHDSLTTLAGCDSVYILHLNINPNHEFTENAAICFGSSFAWHGNTYTTQGIYYDSLTTVAGCDSVYMLLLTVNDLPIVNLLGLDTLYCIYNPPVTLNGMPVGGSYSGQGINGNEFFPANAGIGVWPVLYTYTNNNGCSNSDTVYVIVDECIGTDEIQEQDIKLYPNPGNGIFSIEGSQIRTVWVNDLTGKLIYYKEFQTEIVQIDLSSFPKAVYILKVFNGEYYSFARILLQ